jgi:hypothetical protein
VTFAEWVKANPPPDLQDLVRKYGGYHLIPPEAWTQYDQALVNWNAEYCVWHLQ